MKKSVLFVLLLVAILALGISSAGAQAFTYTSGFQVQNLASSQATLVITFVNQDGSQEAALTGETIPANGSQTYFPLSAVPDGFNGSVVISSDEPVAAITNVIGDNFSAAAAYEAVSEGSTTVLLPLLMQNNSGFSTWFNVQNTGSATATVNVAYSDGASAGPVSIEPGASQTFIQTAETHTQAVFSGVITSDQPVAASVIEESSAVMFAYSGFNAGSTNPVMPLINANNSGYVTGIQIQNARRRTGFGCHGFLHTVAGRNRLHRDPDRPGKFIGDLRTVRFRQRCEFDLCRWSDLRRFRPGDQQQQQC